MELVCVSLDNSDHEAYHCPELDASIDQASINFDTNQFTVHMPTGDLIIALICWRTTHKSPATHSIATLPLIDYMIVMGARCTEQDRGLKTSTTFRNIHCVGRWIQHNILGLDHTTSFNRPVLQIIHDLMTRQHTVSSTRPSFTVSSQTPCAHAVPNTHIRF